MEKIAFIGLGNMGAPMAVNLLNAGYDVTAFDLNEQAVSNVVAKGAQAGRTVADMVSGVDIVITMLPGDKAVEAVYQDVIANADEGTLFIDSSTISASVAKAVAEHAGEKGFDMIDAPVSGGTAGAEAGTLTFIVGGTAEALDRARGVLDVMGKNIFHAGDHGAGQMAKICNNMLLAITMIGTSEALNMGMAYGLDAKVLSDIMAQSSGNNWVLNVYNPVPGVMDGVPASRGYSGGFGNALMAKDLGLSQTAANDCDVQTPLGAKALELYQKHIEASDAGLDFSSVLEFIKSQ